jgi:hypothetical protein
MGQSLDPTNGNKGKWKERRDAKLVEAVEKHGKDGSQLPRWFTVEQIGEYRNIGSGVWVLLWASLITI